MILLPAYIPNTNLRHTLLSGIEINQNVLSATTTLPTMGYQTFLLPSDFARGFVLPDITGIQFCCDTTTVDTVQANVLLRLAGHTENLVSGSITTTSLRDSREWIDVYFDEPIPVNADWLDLQLEIGLQSELPVWYSTTVPLINQTTTIAGGQLAFRLLCNTADSSQDFLSNHYRSVVRRSSVDAVTTAGTANPNSFWLSKPNPSKYAVESLYFDVSDHGAPTVTDRILIDPITPGPYFTIYYSSEGEPATTDTGWEQKLWTPVFQQFRMERRTEHALPKPISARYLKVEFSHLQGQHYSAGTFAQPIRYKKHPKWVLDYFLARLGDVTEDPYVARNVQVLYNTLSIGYNYYLDDLHQNPENPVIDKIALNNFLLNRDDVSDQIDSNTLVQIQTDLSPYLKQPGARSPGTDYLLSTYGPPLASSYPTENRLPAVADVTQVSQLDRDNLVVEQNLPVMFYYLACRHTYRELEANFANDRAYFVGVRELAFIRDHYTSASDTDTYVDNLSDFSNVFRNDFLELSRPVSSLGLASPSTSGPNWSFEYPIDLDGSPSSPGWGIYPNDPWPTVNTPMAISERTQTYASDGSWSWHLKTPVGDGGDLHECDVAAINPATWTGDGDPFPNGWWPVVEGDEWTWKIDLMPIHNTTNNVWIEIDFFDSSGSVVGNQEVGSTSESFQTLTVIATVPAGAIWAAPNIETYPSLGEYVECYIDNAVWEPSPVLLHRFAAMPTSIDSTTIVTPPAGVGTTVFSATGLPPGLTINSSTGIISGSPTAVGATTGNVTATKGTDSSVRGIEWSVTTAGFLKLAEFLDPALAITVEPGVAYLHANRCYLQGWMDYFGPWQRDSLFTPHNSRQVNILDKPLPPAYRPATNTAVTLRTVTTGLSGSDEVYDGMSYQTEVRTDGTWVFTDPGPVPEFQTTFWLSDASWPVAAITGVNSSPSGTPTDLSSLLTNHTPAVGDEFGSGYWTADTPLTVERRNDGGGGDGSIRVFTNGKIRWNGIPWYRGGSLFNPNIEIDGTWTASSSTSPFPRRALTNNTGHGAGFDGATLKDNNAKLAGDFDLTVKVALGPSGHAPGSDSKWWGIGYTPNTPTSGGMTDSLIVLHNDSLGASSCLKLYRWQGGSTLTLLDTSPTYAGGTTTPSSSNFWYSLKRVGHNVTYTLYTTDPRLASPTVLTTKTFALIGAVDTALGPDNTIASPLYLMYALSGDAVSTMSGSYFRPDIPLLGYADDTRGPIGVYSGFGGPPPTGLMPSTFAYHPPIATYADASPTRGNWFFVPQESTSKVQPFSVNVDGAIQVFGYEEKFAYGNETAIGELLPPSQSFTNHTDAYFNPKVLVTPAPFDDGYLMGKRNIGFPNYTSHARDIHVTQMYVKYNPANTGKAGIIDRYDSVSGAYYAFVYNQGTSTSYTLEWYRIDPTAGTPSTLIATSSSLPNRSTTGLVPEEISLNLTTWLDTDPASGQTKVYWNANGYDGVNHTPVSVSVSSEIGKTSGGLGIDKVQGQVGRGKTTGSAIVASRFDTESPVWDITRDGLPRDQEVFNFNGLGWVAVDDPTTWQYIRADVNSNYFELPYGVPLGAGTPVTPHAGNSPYTWSIDVLPPGVSMTSGNPNPTFSGTPTSLGVTNSEITVTDSNGFTDTEDILWLINYVMMAPVTASVARGASYSLQITYTPNGVGSPTFALAPGVELPTGLSLSSSGLISGTVDPLCQTGTWIAATAILTGTIAGKPLQNNQFYISLTIT